MTPVEGGTADHAEPLRSAALVMVTPSRNTPARLSYLHIIRGRASDVPVSVLNVALQHRPSRWPCHYEPRIRPCSADN